MDNRLERLLSGQFEYEIPKMLLSGHSVSLRAEKGKNARGAFVITHPKEGKVRGFLRASNPRILLYAKDFFGHENIIRFEVRTEGMKPGETTKGDIRISSDLGEDTVHVTVLCEPEQSEERALLPDIAAESEKDFEHAASVFCSPEYRRQLMTAGLPSDRALYKALEKEENPLRRLEEFLVGTGKKESVDITSDWTMKKITDPEGTLRETITLKASCRGYQEIGITSDARFLRPEKKKLTTMEFAGGSCEVGLIIDSNFLHAGKNYGRVMIRTPYRTIELIVRAVRSGNGDERRLHRVRSLMVRKAMTLYLDYRIGRIDLHNWSERTESVLGAYRRAGGKDVYADLFSVFVLQADGKRREAERLLGQLEKTPERFTTPDRYAFLLFLTTFFTRDMEYINKARTAVRKLSVENPADWRIFWVCLYLLDDMPGGDSERYEAVKKQIRLECSSPVIYLEGALLLRKNPYLLHEITPATKQILNFASRYDLLTEQLYLEIASEEKRKPRYDAVVYRVLKRCKDKSGARDILEALCAMAISGGKKSREFFPLYQAAVMKEISVTGLYEYYMEAMDECRIETMPEIIRRYFLYNDTLDYHKKARIFRNMADSRRQIPGIFSSMLPRIGKFLVDQLAQGHIDNDLAVLYEEFLQRSMLTKRLAQNLLRILFTYRLDCLRPDMKKVILSDSRLSGEQETELKDQAALIRIYSDQTRILLEDEQGRRYASTSLYMTDHYLESPRLMQLCINMVPEAAELALFYALNTTGKEPVDRGNLQYFRKAVSMDGLTETFRSGIRRWILDFYSSGEGEDSADTFLKEASPEEYAEADPEKMQTLLVSEGYYEEAYRLSMKYGYDHTPLNLLVRIASQMVLAADYQEDDILLANCAYCFFAGKYDANILTYLTMYFDGTVGEMLMLRNVARLYGLDTMALEKKILTLAVFEGDAETDCGEVLQAYRESLGSRKLCRAYEILMSFGYFVKGTILPDAVVSEILREAGQGRELPDICALALLKRMSGKAERSEEEDKICRTLLEKYEDRGIRFSFFQEYPGPMHSDCGILEKTFFEYKASSDSEVMLSFRRKGMDEAFTEETMHDVCAGVFVKEFLLFPGEEMECFTEEKRTDGTRILSGTSNLKGSSAPENEKDTRYGKLSSLSEALQHGDEEKAKEILLDIRQTDAFADEIFTLV